MQMPVDHSVSTKLPYLQGSHPRWAGVPFYGVQERAADVWLGVAAFLGRDWVLSTLYLPVQVTLQNQASHSCLCV